MEKTPMRDTEIVLNSPETDARETPTQGLNEHHDTKQRPRARGRGEHGSSATAPLPRPPPPQPRRRAARPAERRAATGEPRLTPGAGTGAMTENSLDLFLRSARQHPLLTAEEEIELAQRIERGDLAAKEKRINSHLRL